MASLESSELVYGGTRSRQNEEEERGEGAVGEEGHVEVEEGHDRVWCGGQRTKGQGEGTDPEDGGKTEDGKVNCHQYHPLQTGFLVHLEVWLQAEVPLRGHLAHHEEGGGHRQQVRFTVDQLREEQQ